uniref:PSMD12/CSN4-like N-terminal domain-containing protein n=1 Tax=Glossina brevipalpis TaxID=37001 RepID=A0A1A9WCS1_9MUSC
MLLPLLCWWLLSDDGSGGGFLAFVSGIGAGIGFGVVVTSIPHSMVITVEKTIRRLLSINSFQGSLMEHDYLYQSLLDEIFTNAGQACYDAYEVFVDNMISGKVSFVLAGLTMTNVVSRLSQLNDIQSMNLAQITLKKLEKNPIFEKHIADLIQLVVEIVERHGFASEAAKTLATLPLETNSTYNTPLFKFDTYVKIARLFLAADDVDQAEIYINRAAVLQAKITAQQSNVAHRMCYARILERKHKFVEAAKQYVDLSAIPYVSMPVLQRAIICTILSPVCELRSALLAQLYQDPRIKSLLAHEIIEKMHLLIVVKRPELQQFETLLQEHHKTITADGLSILDRAIIEHNVMAGDKVCDIIAFDALAAMSGTATHLTELVAARMIAEGRLDGFIGEKIN